MQKVQKNYEKVYKSSDNMTKNILYLAFFKGLTQHFDKNKKTFPKKIEFIKYYWKPLRIDY